MILTERQARQRLAEAIKRCGGRQCDFARQLPIKPRQAQSVTSRSVLGRIPVHPSILEVLGLRRDANGDIHDDQASFKFVAVQASGEAGVAAAVALIGTILGRSS
jgi:hypothetical protein